MATYVASINIKVHFPNVMSAFNCFVPFIAIGYAG